MPAATRPSDGKAFAAAALTLDIRVVEFETFVEAFTGVVQNHAVQEQQALRIHNQLDAVAFEYDLVRLYGVHELKHIGLARAAGRTHAETQAFALAALLERLAHMCGGGFGETDSHRLVFRLRWLFGEGFRRRLPFLPWCG